MQNYNEKDYLEDQINLMSFLKLLKKYKKFVIIPTLVFFILTLVLGIILKSEYKSTLEIRPNKEYIDTYDENIDTIINSYELKEYIVKKNSIDRDYIRLKSKEITDVTDVIYWLDDIVKIKREVTQTNPIGTILIEVTTKNKEFSERLASAYYVDLIDFMKLKRSKYYERKIPYLEKKVKELGDKITEKNKNLEIMNGKINISGLDNSIEKDIVAYETAMGELIDAKIEKVEYRNSILLVNKPKIAEKPVMNKKIIYPIIGVILGFMVGVFLALIVSMVENEKIRNKEN